jgi:hypothetical protein
MRNDTAEASGIEGVPVDRATVVANAVVEEERLSLATAFESGNLDDVEQVFYRMFQRVYTAGYEDGRA